MSAKPDFRKPSDSGTLDFIPGNTDCGRAARAVNWAATPLGDPSGWSPVLRMMVPFVLANRFPQMLWWGPDYINIYNDAYAPVLGAKHPWAMGIPVRDCWSEVWDVLQPLIDTPFKGGPATWIEDFDLELRRHGFVEESHFTVAYSPVPDESAPGGIGGVLATVHEITQKVIGERRVGILRDLAHLAESRTDVEACASAAEILARHPKDVPFALLYLLDANGRTLKLVSRTGIEAAAAGDALIDLESRTANLRWPLGEALRAERTQIARRVEGLPTISYGAATHVPEAVAVVPIRSNIAHKPAGALVVGISPRIRLDELYSSFLELVGSQIATAVANARAYEEERRRAASLAELDRAKTAFFSNVSHEFRTPLTLMLGPLEEALDNESLPSATRAHLQVAQRNSLRLLKLVNSLLDFARIEAGRVTASFEPLDLAALTQDLASNFRSAMQRAGLDFRVECEPLPQALHVDREMWEKIVLNLVSNAFKFTLEGSVALRLSAQADHALLEVSDTGIGVAAHEVPRLFERFHRVEGAQGRTHEGSGIGLALVQELVKLHGGSIEAHSEPGRGSTFLVRIPYGFAHLPVGQLRGGSATGASATNSQAFVQEALRWLPEARAGETITMRGLSEAAGRLSDMRFASTFGARILLADDNADMRGYVRELLDPLYEIEAVSNGEAALAAVRARRPDLVISDVMMPQLDGLGLLQALRADATVRDVPLILLSARAGEEARIQGLNAGADDYLVKPFTARELLARVGALLELTRTRREHEERQRRELEEASRQKDEFLAMLAHELRNPLAPIRNAGEILLRNLPADVGLRTAVHTIERQVTHLTRLVDDLLDVSRITRGRIELRPRPTLLADLVSRAIETVDPMLRRKRHMVSVAASRWNLYVNVDPERLVQCFSNVLTNSIKYTENGGEIHVDLREDGDEVVVTVSDNGMGIAPELQPRIFDLFVQAERTLDRAQGGLGIGLSIVKRLVEMHDGRVAIRSEGENRGTTFEMRLPLLRGEHDTRPVRETHARHARRVLVVDDNEDAANTLAMVLRMEGHDIATAYSGQEALALIEQFAPEVVLLDIGLPGIDGLEVARRIRELAQGRDATLVAITGYGQEADRARTRDAGFAHHLVKPVDFADLERLLSQLQ